MRRSGNRSRIWKNRENLSQDNRELFVSSLETGLMTCPRTHLIVRLASGELPPAEEGDLREHLEACPVCTAAYSEMQQTWNALGNWPLDLSGIDLTERVLAEADAEGRRPSHPIRLAGRWAVPLRAAASIILAVGLGVAAGRLIPAGKSAAVTESPASLEGMTEALELIAFASESATGLPFSLESYEAPTGDEMP
jgi:anti-sigma factor RsiW